MSTQDTLRRVKSLLAKEHAPGTTPQEVAAALAMATRLLEREGLTRAALTDAPEKIELVGEPLDKQRRLSRWRASLGSTLARHFGCSIYQTMGVGLMIVGKPSDAETVRYLYAYCTREIDRLAASHARGRGATYANNFRLGCVCAIANAIRAERDAERDAQRAAAGTPGALVVLNGAIARMDSAADAAARYARERLNLRQTRATGSRYDSAGRAAGEAAGASIYPGKRTGLGSGPRGYLK